MAKSATETRPAARVFGLSMAAVVLCWTVPVDAQIAKQVATGRALFRGKGNCTVCHTIGRTAQNKRARGPDLAGIGTRAAERAKQFNLHGPGAATRYLVRAIIRPDSDVIKGYNRAPESWLPSQLTDGEIRSLVVYLQSLGGAPRPDQIALPAEFLKTKRQEYQRELSLFSLGDPKKGEKLFHDKKGKAGCINCHKIDGQGANVCPELTMVTRVQRPSYVLESILDSSRFLVRGYRQVILVDDNGKIHTGLPVKEDKDTITLVIDQRGKTEVVQKEAIDVKKFSRVSQMPGNFSEVLTAGQVLNLASYVLRHEEFSAAKIAKTKPSGPLPPPTFDVFGPLTDGQKRYRLAMERGDPVMGSRVYKHYCIMCHGPNGQGNGFNAVNLKTKPANHTDNRRMSKTEDLLLQGVITRGGMKTGRSFLMPPWGGVLTDRQRWDLVAFLRTLHANMRSPNYRAEAKHTEAKNKGTSNAQRRNAIPP
ncbi:MAG: c-type cytochrome [Planctomycetaceae bacterium]